MVIETMSRNQGSELSSATMIPQLTVVLPTPLSSKWLRVMVPWHPRGNLPQVKVPSPPRPPITRQGTRNTKQESEHERM